MDRINGADTIDIGGGRRGFRSENLVAGVAGTEVTDVFLTSVQEEILKVITEAGLIPDIADWSQLWQALKILGLSTGSKNRRWTAVTSMTVAAPPANPATGDTYLIPAGASGAWAANIGKIADWTGSAWSYLSPPDGHGIGLTDGRVFMRIAGEYVEWLESRSLTVTKLSRLPWLPVLSVSLSSAPGAPTRGDTYLVPTGATGVWATNTGKIAEWTGSVWSYATPVDGHGISLPDGRVFERIGGTYVEKIALDVQSGKWIYGQAGGTANALTLTLPITPQSYSLLRLVIVHAVLANTGSVVTININGLGARPIVRKGGGPLRKGDIQPGPMILVDNGTGYELIGTTGLYRTAMSGNLDLYVSTTGSDTVNDGLSAASPFKTLQRAWSEIVNNYDLNGFIANVNIADGTYADGVFATSAPLGGNAGVGAVTFKSSSGNASAVIISKTGGTYAFYAQGGAQYLVKDMTIQSSGAGASGVVAGIGGVLAIDGVRFGECTRSHMFSISGGFIQASGNYTIVGAAQYHALATSLGQVLLPGRTVTITGTPAFLAFAYCSQGRIDCTGVSFIGTATGSRYVVEQNGVITVNGAGVNALPGNAAGTTQTGGQYV